MRQILHSISPPRVLNYLTTDKALDKHRGKGQQKVIVEHVHVYRGGQAIVGNVSQGAGVSANSEDQPDAKAITDAREPEMRSAFEAQREAVPVPSDEER